MTGVALIMPQSRGRKVASNVRGGTALGRKAMPMRIKVAGAARPLRFARGAAAVGSNNTGRMPEQADILSR